MDDRPEFKIMLVGLAPLTAVGVEATLARSLPSVSVEHFEHRDPALERAHGGGIDLAILDPTLPTLVEGLRFCRELKEVSSPPYALVLAALRTRRDVMHCFLAGVDSFVFAAEPPESLTSAVRATLGGAREWLLGSAVADPKHELSGAGQLTPRESEVLGMALEGRTNRQIGVSLSISPNTVKNHMAAILRKLGAQRRSDLLPG